MATMQASYKIHTAENYAACAQPGYVLLHVEPNEDAIEDFWADHMPAGEDANWTVQFVGMDNTGWEIWEVEQDLTKVATNLDLKLAKVCTTI